MDVAAPPESIGTLCQLDGLHDWPPEVSPDLSEKLLGRRFVSNVWSRGSHVAQCGRRSSTGRQNLSPCGPHNTSGLSKVSPAQQISVPFIHGSWRQLCLHHHDNVCVCVCVCVWSHACMHAASSTKNCRINWTQHEHYITWCHSLTS
jgi:hypothetical protein